MSTGLLAPAPPRRRTQAEKNAHLRQVLTEQQRLNDEARVALRQLQVALDDRANVYDPPPNPAYAVRRPWAELASARESVCSTLLSARPSQDAVINAIDANRARLVDPATPISERAAVLMCAARIADPAV